MPAVAWRRAPRAKVSLRYDLGPVLATLAGIGIVLSPVAAAAQSRDADDALKALIPDSALDNPEAWALDTDAARTPAPDVSTLLTPEALPPLPAMPAITLDWPDAAELPTIEPLSPDPDIADARAQAEAAGELLDKDEGAQGTRIANATLVNVGKNVILAFPPDVEMPDRSAIVERFKGLSALSTLKNDEENLAQLTRRSKADAELLQQILRVYGYYDPDVIPSTDRPTEPGGTIPENDDAAARAARRAAEAAAAIVRFDIQPGPQYTFAKITLGDVMAARDAQALRAAYHIQPGDPINSDKILLEKDSLSKELGERGYAFATLGDPSLVIDHEPRTGDLDQPVTTGGIYRFGHVTSSDPAYLSSRHLERIARFRPGDLYKRSEMDDLREGLLATSLVSTVGVKTREVSPPANGEPGVVDVDVTLTKAPQRTLAGLIGYSSGQGFRLEGSWEHRNLFPPEGMLRVRGVAGTQEQLAGVTFRKNNFRERDQVLTADLYAQTLKNPAYDANTLSALITLEKQSTLIFQKPWTYSFGLELVGTQETTATKPKATYVIAALPLRGAYDASDNLLDPTRGWRLSLRVSPEISTTNGTKSTYVKSQVDASIYHGVGSRVVLAARTRLGSIQGTSLDNIAPSRRFYAGGGASIRGFSYQRVGPLDATGEPTGGRSLTEFSLEARIKTGLFGGAVGVVPFVDAGTIGPKETPTLNGMRIGAGLGLRYQTNFGPIRIDVGTPINRRPGDSRLGVYIALGQAF